MNGSSPAPIDTLIQSFLGSPPTFDTFLALIKFFVLIALTLYLVFGLVIIRQINQMNSTIRTNISFILQIAGWVHLGLSLVVWFIAFVVL
ncbi:MAG: hypothetical protein UX04_C0002G0094 [Microgenomates group bacterium GW2011_GWF2_45_18]|nr:MAG: hypothetical protein UW18_C0001G0003 [Microgenomates group bacterium GW2011_GWF1_44_10]KKU01951.1 MAG: hypothetical protein UX04_C0002G0094 [Microgenomates group bacterium GW2011_GWF2_45_18]OGJ41475.1 MAG: hypothetical protein A2378_00110 [Candidatus Pacebacteria bacterium RIFOXYB1_FULL_44_10]HAU98736.1 hypothetical protein [Candidatus Paceibacterota bacterium]HAX01444.1 hypothetical protein [Candidatus Paceibacterota bacterium]